MDCSTASAVSESVALMVLRPVRRTLTLPGPSRSLHREPRRRGTRGRAGSKRDTTYRSARGGGRRLRLVRTGRRGPARWVHTRTRPACRALPRYGPCPCRVRRGATRAREEPRLPRVSYRPVRSIGVRVAFRAISAWVDRSESTPMSTTGPMVPSASMTATHDAGDQRFHICTEDGLITIGLTPAPMPCPGKQRRNGASSLVTHRQRKDAGSRRSHRGLRRRADIPPRRASAASAVAARMTPDARLHAGRRARCETSIATAR